MNRLLLSLFVFALSLVGCGGGASRPAPIPVSTPGLSFIAGSTGGGGYVLDGAGPEARFARPDHIAVDSAGNVYLTDGNTLRKVTPGGVVTTIAGMPGQGWETGRADAPLASARFATGARIAVDQDGNLYVADLGIRKFSPSGDLAAIVPDAGGDALALDPLGNLYFSQRTCGVREPCVSRIIKRTRDGATMPLANNQGQVATFSATEIKALAVDAAGNVFFLADTSSGQTIRKRAVDGEITELTKLASPPGMFDSLILAPGGDLYASESAAHVIRKISPLGSVTLVAGKPGVAGTIDAKGDDARFNLPGDVASDSAGNLYVADTGNHTVRKIAPDGAVTTLAGTGMGRIYGNADGTGAAAQFTNPQGIAADSLGNLYVADTAAHTIRKISPGGAVTTLAGLANSAGSMDGPGKDARFSGPRDVAVDRNGAVYVTDSVNATIRKIGVDGLVTTLAGLAGQRGTADGRGTAARFTFPQAIATDQAGNLFVTDSVDTTIRKITPDGVVTTFAGSLKFFGLADGVGTAAQFAAPHGIAVDGAGNLYVADTANGSIRKVSPDARVTTVSNTTGKFYGANGIAVDTDGAIYVTNLIANKSAPGEVGTSTISRIAVDGAIITVAGIAGQQRIALGPLPGTLELPFGIARMDAKTFAVTSGSSVLKLTVP